MFYLKAVTYSLYLKSDLKFVVFLQDVKPTELHSFINKSTYRTFGKSLCTIKGAGSDVHERLYRPEPI
jgi:hypothetical protein